MHLKKLLGVSLSRGEIPPETEDTRDNSSMLTLYLLVYA